MNERPRVPCHVYLTEWMRHRGIDADQMAVNLETTKPTISKLMSGRLSWNINWLAECAYWLNCSVADLLALPASPIFDTATQPNEINTLGHKPGPFVTTILTDEIVEKAARAMWHSDMPPPYPWEDASVETQGHWLIEARAALEAALPDIAEKYELAVYRALAGNPVHAELAATAIRNLTKAEA